MQPDEQPFTFDPVHVIPTDELIDELLSRFPTVVVGYIDQEDNVTTHWEGFYFNAVGIARVLEDMLCEERDV